MASDSGLGASREPPMELAAATRATVRIAAPAGGACTHLGPTREAAADLRDRRHGGRGRWVVYQAAADNVTRPLPIRLHRVNQPALSSRNGFSTPHATLLT